MMNDSRQMALCVCQSFSFFTWPMPIGPNDIAYSMYAVTQIDPNDLWSLDFCPLFCFAIPSRYPILEFNPTINHQIHINWQIVSFFGWPFQIICLFWFDQQTNWLEIKLWNRTELRFMLGWIPNNFSSSAECCHYRTILSQPWWFCLFLNLKQFHFVFIALFIGSLLVYYQHLVDCIGLVCLLSISEPISSLLQWVCFILLTVLANVSSLKQTADNRVSGLGLNNPLIQTHTNTRTRRHMRCFN